MFRHAWIRIKRMPLIFVAILLFTASIALALCGLHSGNDTALEEYNDIYYNIDVRCTVTNLAGDQSRDLRIGNGILSLFTNSDFGVMGVLLEDIQISASSEITLYGEQYKLVGITSTEIAPNLWDENGCMIFWNEGFDGNIFSGDKNVCIIPTELEKKLQESSQSLDFVPLHLDAGHQYETDYDGTLSVIGVYEAKDNRIIYCPWETYGNILASMNRALTADSLYATLSDNRKLSQMQETASKYFAEPDPNNAGLDMVGDFYLALDINDSQLSQAKTNLENSITVNRIAAVLIFVLTAVAGAFIGFLMIRNRKKEIALMRTMGTPSSRIYMSFVIEQMVFVVLGSIVGGSPFMWNPISWLVLFVCVYSVGLSAALLIMLRKNLLTTIKEDE